MWEFIGGLMIVACPMLGIGVACCAATVGVGYGVKAIVDACSEQESDMWTLIVFSFIGAAVTAGGAGYGLYAGGKAIYDAVTSE